MTTTRINGIDIYYEEHGPADGEPVLLIMGFMSHAGIWFAQVEALKECYRVIALDNRGAGRSSAPEGPYSIAQMADDADALLGHLGISSAHIVGASMGGMIAQEFALRHPGRVCSLVLMCTTPGGPRSFGHAEMIEASVAVREAESMEQLQTPERLQENLLQVFTPEFMQGNSPQLQAAIVQGLQHLPAIAGVKAQMAAILAHDTVDRLPRIAALTLVMTGKDDTLVDARNSSLLAERIPNAELRTFDGARHGFNIECAEAVNEALLAFLAKHAAVPATA